MSIDHMTVYASKLSVRIAELERENAALREALAEALGVIKSIADALQSRAVPPTTESSEND